MSLTVNTNLSALDAYRNLSNAQNAMSSNLQHLSSGSRISRAADDASGLVISQKLQSTIGGLAVATKNANAGIGVVQTAEGALDEVTTMLQRIRDLSLSSANTGAVDSNAQQASQAEVNALVSDIGRIGQSTAYAGKNLLQGYSGNFVIGADTSASNVVSFSIGALATTGVMGTSVDISSLDLVNNASAAVSVVDQALDAIATARGSLGALQNRFDHAISNISVTSENLTAAKSSITDTDMASEMTSFSKNQILVSAATSMLTQANNSGQNILKLLQG